MLPIIYGGLAGILRAVLGWAKSEEKFNPVKLIKTLLVFSITGFVIGLYVEDPMLVFAMSFIGVPFEDLIKVIQRKF